MRPLVELAAELVGDPEASATELVRRGRQEPRQWLDEVTVVEPPATGRSAHQRHPLVGGRSAVRAAALPATSQTPFPGSPIPVCATIKPVRHTNWRAAKVVVRVYFGVMDAGEPARLNLRMNGAGSRRSYSLHEPPDGAPPLHGDAAVDHGVPGPREGAGPVVTAKDPLNDYTDPPTVDDHSTSLSGGAAWAAAGPTEEPAYDAEFESLGLAVEHPANGVCVVTVDGELDMLTAPLLEACLREQLCTHPRHLVLDLQPVRFLSSSGLNCLLHTRDSAQTSATRLHLAGLVTRAVARPLQVSQLLDVFHTYPTVTHALTVITA